MDKDDRSVNLKKLGETAALRLTKRTKEQMAQDYFSQRRQGNRPVNFDKCAFAFFAPSLALREKIAKNARMGFPAYRDCPLLLLLAVFATLPSLREKVARNAELDYMNVATEFCYFIIFAVFFLKL